MGEEKGKGKSWLVEISRERPIMWSVREWCGGVERGHVKFRRPESHYTEPGPDLGGGLGFKEEKAGIVEVGGQIYASLGAARK